MWWPTTLVLAIAVAACSSTETKPVTFNDAYNEAEVTLRDLTFELFAEEGFDLVEFEHASRCGVIPEAGSPDEISMYKERTSVDSVVKKGDEDAAAAFVADVSQWFSANGFVVVGPTRDEPSKWRYRANSIEYGFEVEQATGRIRLTAVLPCYPHNFGTLSDAVTDGNVSRVTELLSAGAEPDEPVVHGFTPLMRAAIRDDPHMMQILLDAGADHEAQALEGLTPLHVAAEAGAVDAVRTLIEAGADLGARSYNGMNTLEHAAAAGSADVIALVAGTGADLDAHSQIVTQGHGYPVDEGSTALGIAARAGHVGAITALLDLGARIDAPSAVGHTPLLAAIFSGQPPEVISILLKAGADPTVQVACRTRCSYDEGDALVWVRRIGDPDTIPLIEFALDG